MAGPVIREKVAWEKRAPETNSRMKDTALLVSGVVLLLGLGVLSFLSFSSYIPAIVSSIGLEPLAVGVGVGGVLSLALAGVGAYKLACSQNKPTHQKPDELDLPQVAPQGHPPQPAPATPVVPERLPVPIPAPTIILACSQNKPTHQKPDELDLPQVAPQGHPPQPAPATPVVPEHLPVPIPAPTIIKDALFNVYTNGATPQQRKELLRNYLKICSLEDLRKWRLLIGTLSTEECAQAFVERLKHASRERALITLKTLVGNTRNEYLLPVLKATYDRCQNGELANYLHDHWSEFAAHFTSEEKVRYLLLLIEKGAFYNFCIQEDQIQGLNNLEKKQIFEVLLEYDRDLEKQEQYIALARLLGITLDLDLARFLT